MRSENKENDNHGEGWDTSEYWKEVDKIVDEHLNKKRSPSQEPHQSTRWEDPQDTQYHTPRREAANTHIEPTEQDILEDLREELVDIKSKFDEDLMKAREKFPNNKTLSIIGEVLKESLNANQETGDDLDDELSPEIVAILEIVFFPINKFEHYYLICYGIKAMGYFVIDNILRDGEPKVYYGTVPDVLNVVLFNRGLVGLEDGEMYRYFFSKRSSKNASDKRAVRQTKDGKGFWKVNNRDRTDITGMSKHTLVYCSKDVNVKGRGQQSRWIMHEYALVTKTEDKVPVIEGNENLVVCGIYQRKAKREEKEAAEEETAGGENTGDRNAEAPLLDLIGGGLDQPSGDQPPNVAEENFNLNLEL
ncbi:hypothetical protein ACET3Z_030602 [Daucus carota]